MQITPMTADLNHLAEVGVFFLGAMAEFGDGGEGRVSESKKRAQSGIGITAEDSRYFWRPVWCRPMIGDAEPRGGAAPLSGEKAVRFSGRPNRSRTGDRGRSVGRFYRRIGNWETREFASTVAGFRCMIRRR
jgi:hypothetical protein